MFNRKFLPRVCLCVLFIGLLGLVIYEVAYIYESAQHEKLITSSFSQIKYSRQINNSIIETQLIKNHVKTRDFARHTCKSAKRIGGKAEHVQNAPSPDDRVDGAWFVCFDGLFSLIKNDCVVYSFGVGHELTFDSHIHEAYSCRVFSFDPYVEAQTFQTIRNAVKQLVPSVQVSVDHNWNFYRLGLSEQRSTTNVNVESAKVGDLMDLKSIFDYTKMKNHIIDVLRIDIGEADQRVMETLDMDYVCRFVKQFMIKTSLKIRFNDLVKLEKCFFLFRRDTRFYIHRTDDEYRGLLSEFQQPNGFKLDLKLFGDELKLAEFMFVTGELHFLNQNYVFHG